MKKVFLGLLLLVASVVAWNWTTQKSKVVLANGQEELSGEMPALRTSTVPVNKMAKSESRKIPQAQWQEAPKLPATPQSRENFASLVESVSKKIPTSDQLRELSNEQVHFTPAILQEAGAQLGRVAEALEKDPQLIPEGVSFYKNCARQNSYPSSVRAVCLSDLMVIYKNQGLPIDQLQSELGVPSGVMSLAERLL